MTIATKLKQHLDISGVRYDTVRHPRTVSVMESAEAAHILPSDAVAKTVVIHLEPVGWVLRTHHSPEQQA